MQLIHPSLERGKRPTHTQIYYHPDMCLNHTQASIECCDMHLQRHHINIQASKIKQHCIHTNTTHKCSPPLTQHTRTRTRTRTHIAYITAHTYTHRHTHTHNASITTHTHVHTHTQEASITAQTHTHTAAGLGSPVKETEWEVYCGGRSR